MCGLWAEHPGTERTAGVPQRERDPGSYGREEGRVKARTAITFPHNLPAPFHVNILWTEQKWQNQSITPEPTQRGIERLTEIDDIPAGILHWFGQPYHWNRQRFIVLARTLAPLDCLDFFLCAPAYLSPSSSPACSIRMLIWFYIPRRAGIMQPFAWCERNHQNGFWYQRPKWSLMFPGKSRIVQYFLSFFEIQISFCSSRCKNKKGELGILSNFFKVT